MINSLGLASSPWDKSFPEHIFPKTFYDIKENNATYTSCDCVESLLSQGLLSQSPRWYLSMISQNFAQIIPKWPSKAQYFIFMHFINNSITFSPSKFLCPIWTVMEGNRAKITMHPDLYQIPSSCIWSPRESVKAITGCQDFQKIHKSPFVP